MVNGASSVELSNTIEEPLLDELSIFNICKSALAPKKFSVIIFTSTNSKSSSPLRVLKSINDVSLLSAIVSCPRYPQATLGVILFIEMTLLTPSLVDISTGIPVESMYALKST